MQSGYMAGRDESISVEIVYALPDEQLLIKLEVAAGTTARQAIDRSGILRRFPQIDPVLQNIGIFGKTVRPDCVLRSGDRVEIYRPLIVDPKEARRRRAAKKD